MRDKIHIWNNLTSGQMLQVKCTFSQLKKHVSSLNFVYCFTGFIGRGADFTCMSGCVSNSCQKSQNIHAGYGNII